MCTLAPNVNAITSFQLPQDLACTQTFYACLRRKSSRFRFQQMSNCTHKKQRKQSFLSKRLRTTFNSKYLCSCFFQFKNFNSFLKVKPILKNLTKVKSPLSGNKHYMTNQVSFFLFYKYGQKLVTQGEQRAQQWKHCFRHIPQECLSSNVQLCSQLHTPNNADPEEQQ